MSTICIVHGCCAHLFLHFHGLYGNISILPDISGSCQQFTLSYPPKGTYSCPGSNITYTCKLCSHFAGVTTVWRGSAFNCPSTGSQVANRLALYQKSDGVVNPHARGSCGSLSAVTTNVSTDGYCYTSVLTIPAVQGLNGTTVMCVDGVTGAVVGNDTVNVKVAGEMDCVNLMLWIYLQDDKDIIHDA